MKSNIIQNVQHLASKLFNKEVARMHYATDRLTGFTLNEILDLQIPVITEDAILPVPINPKFINFDYFILIILN